MLTPIEKIIIYYNIKKNKSNVQYKCYHDIEETIHEVKIPDMHLTIRKTSSLYNGNLFSLSCLNENVFGTHSETIDKHNQSFFDKIFISKMYYKMLNYYTAKNSLSHNNKTRQK